MTYPLAEEETWFEGTFLNNKWDKGLYKKGSVTYEGTFVDQQMTGNFKVEWANTGIRYEGMVKDGKLHGEGVIFFNDESNIAQIEGVWN